LGSPIPAVHYCRPALIIQNWHYDQLWLFRITYLDILYLFKSFGTAPMLRTLALQQLDRALTAQSHPARPAGGWLRAIRQALGQTTRQLAYAVGVEQNAVMAVERSEARYDVTLATLARYADALGCDLHYVLKPRQPLVQMVNERAERIAREQVSRVQHSMALEDQGTGDEVREQEVQALKGELLEGRLSRLWR
jgi:predicted DNA-binding mobile mystery protein A